MAVSVGDSVLYMSEVMKGIPYGIDSADSIHIMRNVIDTWLRRQVLITIAERNLDNAEEIENMVNRYREDLILDRYLSLMDSRDNVRIDKRKLNLYYKTYGDSMLLEEPLVKGAFIKVLGTDPELEKIREWMGKADNKSIDNLERYGLRSATQYAYFNDKWYPWHEVAELVPYRFFDADAFLESTVDFETNYGGSVYILHISDYRNSGEKMPEEYAKSQIAEMLRHEEVAQRREALISELYSKAIEEGVLKRGVYDPVTGRMNDK